MTDDKKRLTFESKTENRENEFSKGANIAPTARIETPPELNIPKATPPQSSVSED